MPILTVLLQFSSQLNYPDLVIFLQLREVWVSTVLIFFLPDYMCFVALPKAQSSSGFFSNGALTRVCTQRNFVYYLVNLGFSGEYTDKLFIQNSDYTHRKEGSFVKRNQSSNGGESWLLSSLPAFLYFCVTIQGQGRIELIKKKLMNLWLKG